MTELADIFQSTAPEYLALYGRQILSSHRKAIDDIIRCRTRTLGGTTWFCKPCGEYRYSYHSCKNRSCPKCGNDDASRWIAAQNALLLPVPYFLVTVTLPAELRPVARKNQRCIYSLVFKSAAEAIQKLALDPKFIGGKVGIMGVLQTWTRDLRYHPHVHLIVTGGGISHDGKRWLPTQRPYLMPQGALAKIFRAKFRDALKKLCLFDQVPLAVWKLQWVVDIKAIGKGKTAIKYLAPYIFRIAISNQRITRFENGLVWFRVQDNKGIWHSQRLDSIKFMSRFLQHVLPKGFVKVRYYGFLSTRKRNLLTDIKELFESAARTYPESGNGVGMVVHRVITCPKCGRPMAFAGEIKPARRFMNPTAGDHPP